jgi:hypothetical protein
MKAKRTRYLKSLTAAFLITAVFSSCKRDSLDSMTEPQEGPYASLLDFHLQNGVQSQTFVFNADIPCVINGAAGTQINIPGNSLIDSAGNQAIGNITATLKEIYTIKDMILSDMHTTSGGNILRSGGMVYLEFSDGSIHYRPSSTINISMPADSSSIFQNMSVFFGVNDSSGFNWQFADSAYAFVYNNISNYTFHLILDSIGYGWINCDQFYNSFPLTDVTLTPSVTSERNETVELAVYLAFPSINSVANVYGANMQQAVTAYNIPVGMQTAAVVIGTGRVTKKPYFGISLFTVAAGQPVNVSVVQTDEDDINSALQVL